MAAVLQCPLAALLFQHPAEPGTSLLLLGMPRCPGVSQPLRLSLPTMACLWMSLALEKSHWVEVPPCQIQMGGVTFMWGLQGPHHSSGDLGCVGLKFIRGRVQLLVVWCGWGLGASRAGVPHAHTALAEPPSSCTPRCCAETRFDFSVSWPHSQPCVCFFLLVSTSPWRHR